MLTLGSLDMTPFLRGWKHLVRSCKVVVIPDINTGGALHGAISGKLEPLGEIV